MRNVAERSVCRANAGVESIRCEMLHTNSHCQSRLVPVIELQRIVSKLYSIIIVDSVVL
jgi:hypothetical protein